jgi:hypothetical protein
MQLLVPSLSAAALVDAALGDTAGALGHVRELIDVSRGRSDRYRTLFLPELTRLCGSTGELKLARELAAGLTVELGRAGCTRTAAAAELSEAEGRTLEAITLHVESQRRWREFGGVPGLADALLGQSRCLVHLGEAGATPPLTEANELYARLGDVAGQAEAVELLAR